MPKRWREEMDAVRKELEGLQRELVRSAADSRIRLRLFGLAYVVLGLGLSLMGNLTGRIHRGCTVSGLFVSPGWALTGGRRR
jgi:hypothetical protein